MSIVALKFYYPVFLTGLCAGMLLGPTLPVAAQRPKVHTAIEALVAGKLPIFSVKGTPFGIWGSAGLSLVNIVEGMEENALALRNRISFQLDFTRYNIQGYGPFTVDRAGLVVNPEVMFSTARERLKWMAGIGVEWSNYFVAQLQQGNGIVDNDLIDRSRRQLLPFVSGGIQYNLRHDFCVQIFLRQMLLDVFRENTALYFGSGNDKPDLVLNQQATYFGFGLSYFFGPGRED